ncbi:serine/threonine-protein kinase [Nocardia puris]|uniref:serine/threonine-protein kinase n=1 Tax=Nocardia puris TaxID=208602 RepID=UPI002B4B3DED|nr:protein kinase [Nocardia puris]
MLSSGEVFAGFTVERLLGQGGMGSVYLARHPRMARLTALKLLNRDLFLDTEVRARFEREADLAAQLDHPGIVTVYDRGSEDGQLWISMQYVDGVDAAAVNPMTLPPERAVQIIEGVADALDYAHGKGVLHRDVKPANIMLARSRAGKGERVFLTDFGIARLREDSTHLTQTGMFTATLAYASPEQMTGAPLGNRSDQYSLACALYWLLAGIGPFDADNPADIIHGHLQLAPPSVRLRRPKLNPALDLVIAAGMAKRPEYRYATCTEFAAAARKALTAVGPPPLPPPPPVVYAPPVYPGPPGYAQPVPPQQVPRHPSQLPPGGGMPVPPGGAVPPSVVPGVVPPGGGVVPPGGAGVPHAVAPHAGAPAPHPGAVVPSSGAPQPGSAAPPGAVAPPAGSQAPSAGVPHAGPGGVVPHAGAVARQGMPAPPPAPPYGAAVPDAVAPQYDPSAPPGPPGAPYADAQQRAEARGAPGGSVLPAGAQGSPAGPGEQVTRRIGVVGAGPGGGAAVGESAAVGDPSWRAGAGDEAAGGPPEHGASTGSDVPQQGPGRMDSAQNGVGDTAGEGPPGAPVSGRDSQRPGAGSPEGVASPGSAVSQQDVRDGDGVRAVEVSGRGAAVAGKDSGRLGDADGVSSAERSESRDSAVPQRGSAESGWGGHGSTQATAADDASDGTADDASGGGAASEQATRRIEVVGGHGAAAHDAWQGDAEPHLATVGDAAQGEAGRVSLVKGRGAAGSSGPEAHAPDVEASGRGSAPPVAQPVPGAGAAIPPGYPPYGNQQVAHRFPRKPRGSWVVVVLALAAVGILVVAVGVAAVVLLGSDSEEQAAVSVPTTTGAPAPAAPDPFEASRDAFPSLLPRESGDIGEGYEGATCYAERPGDRLRVEVDALTGSDWVLAWECRRDVDDSLSMNYTVFEYETPTAARAVLAALPITDATPGRKQDVPYTAYTWTREDPQGPVPSYFATAHLIIGFPTDPDRSTYLIHVSHRGASTHPLAPRPTAASELDRWWAEAPL